MIHKLVLADDDQQHIPVFDSQPLQNALPFHIHKLDSPVQND